MDNRLAFYTYIHATPDGVVFYVGKGKKGRVYSMSDRSWLWRKEFEKHDGILMKVVKRFATEQEAFEHEMQLVANYKAQGVVLVNMTEGGNGPNGYKQSEETRLIKSKKMRGYKHPVVSCPHCGDVGGATSMKRWHFDNCKGSTPKFKARATVDGQRIYLGKYHTKEEADKVAQDYYTSIGDRKSVV